MANPDIITKAEFVLSGKIAGLPVSLRGVAEQKTISEISGCLTIGKSLSSFFQDLSASHSQDDKLLDLGEAPDLLQQLLGEGGTEVVLKKLGVAYRGKEKEPKFIHLGLFGTVSSANLQFALLKKLGKKSDPSGYIVGLDLSVDNTNSPKNFLSGLVGDIAIGNLGVYYASEAFGNVTFYTGDDFQDASTLSFNTGTGKNLTFPKGLKAPDYPQLIRHRHTRHVRPPTRGQTL